MDAKTILRRLFGDAEYERLEALGNFECGLTCPPEEEMVRKEFQREADIGYQLKMFGAGRAFGKTPVSGFNDDSMDRLAALELLGRAEALFEELPVRVKEKYKTWDAVEQAAMSGELTSLLVPPEPPKEEPKS